MQHWNPEQTNRRQDKTAAREDLDRATARILRACLADAELEDPNGVSQAALAHASGLTESIVSRQLGGQKPVQMRLLVAMLDADSPLEPVGRRVLSKLAARIGKVLADEPRVTDVLNDFHAFASLGTHAGRVLEKIGAALGDGVIDRDEAQSGIRALDALIQIAVSYRERLQVIADGGAERVRANVVPYRGAGA